MFGLAFDPVKPKRYYHEACLNIVYIAYQGGEKHARKL